MSKLTKTERILSFIAFVFVTASIALALCIGFIIPRHWVEKGYVTTEHRSSQEMDKLCGCDLKKITTNYINCIPRTFSERISQPTNNTSDKVEEVCELIQDHPYVVSLNVPAYEDDRKERRLACTGTILTKDWVLVGEDCVFNEHEFGTVKLRAGSTYWSKGGKEYLIGAISKFSDEGPTSVKVTKPFKFGKFVSPVRLSRKGIYTTWITAVSVGWNKERERKYDKFQVQKWITTPCTDNCNKGEVIGNPRCTKKTFEKSLVAEGKLLVGFQAGECYNGNTSKMMFVDVQTEEYQNWFEFLIEKRKNVNATLKMLERELMGTTASPLNVYEVKECIASQYNHLKIASSPNIDYYSMVRNNTHSLPDKHSMPTTKLETIETRHTEITTPTERTEPAKISESIIHSRKTEQTYYIEDTVTTYLPTTPKDETTTFTNPTMFPLFIPKSSQQSLRKSKIDGPDEYEADMDWVIPMSTFPPNAV